MMTFGSLFAGIGGFDLGFERAGMACKWQNEINRECNQVRRKHWPDVRMYHDVKEVGAENLESVNVICGGFPCQDLSVAGKRAGLDGGRSGLWFEFHRVLAELKPKWCIIENVPGLLSSNRGADFDIILRGLEEIGYVGAWRTLDSQYFGVPQRRRRVFIIGHLGGAGGPEVLLESEGGAWDSAPSREAEQGAAATITKRVAGASNQWAPYNEADNLIPTMAIGFDRTRGTSSGDIAAPLRVNGGESPGVNDGKADNQCVAFSAGNGSTNRGIATGHISETVRADSHGAIPMVAQSLSARNQRHCAEDTFVCGAVTSKVARPDESVAQARQLVWEMSHADEAIRTSRDICPTLQQRMGTGGNQVPLVGVRRLTPTECERLQGFPDGWTAGQSDSQRYRQLGNAVTVNVAQFIGERIMEVEEAT